MSTTSAALAGFVLLSLLVVAEVAAYKYGHRHEHLVQQAAGPRHLSAEQKPLIVAKIRAVGWQRAEVIWVGNGEPELYARDLATAFQQAGVEVYVHTLGPFLPSARGLLVVKTTNDDFTRLKAILDAAGVESEIALTNDTLGQKDHPTMVVGARKDLLGMAHDLNKKLNGESGV